MPDSRRDEDPRVRRLADEQAALRRVASLAELTESAARKSAILEWALECIVTIDHEGKILEFNPAAEVTFGYRREDVLGKEMAELVIPPSLREQHYRGLKRYLETGDGPVLRKRVELQGLRSDGTEFPIELTVTPITLAGVPIFTAFVRDITERKRSEEERTRLLRGEREARAEAEAASERAQGLAGEQTALRRVATLVAKAGKPDQVFAAVAQEVADVFAVELVTVCTYESDAILVLSSVGVQAFPAGSAWPLDVPSLPRTIYASGRAARIDDFTDASGLDASARDAGVKAAVGAPIVVNGGVWGAINIATTKSRPFQPNAEERLGRFTDLVATSVSNATMRAELAASEARARGLAEEQAALRHVAELVARAPASEQLFSTVAREVASVLDVPGVIVTRYDADGTALTLGEAFRPDLAGAEQFLGVGIRMPPDPGSLAAEVHDTHGPARIDDFSTLAGTVGDLARSAGLGSGCGGPIMVNGALWGKLCVFSRVGTVLPAGTENRLHDFGELVATAIANYEGRADLAASEARARELAEEQAALRRVATLVAQGAGPDEVFSVVSNEVGRLFGSDHGAVARYDPDGTGMVYVGVSRGARGYSIGTHWPLEDFLSATTVYRTGRSARMDRSDFETASGPLADSLREMNLVSRVAAPIVVEGSLWGVITVSDVHQRLPADTEERLAKFTELVATAIANAESRAELAASEALAHDLAREQAALRRVATLVAEGASTDELFAAAVGEVADVVRFPIVGLGRFEDDRSFTWVAIGGETSFTVGTRWPVEDEGLAGMILATGGPARKEDYSTMPGPLGAAVRDDGVSASVGVPIVVDGRIWGFMLGAVRPGELIPDGTEERLGRFTELVATSVSSATMREELAASRARVIAAADDARRRIERNLHDGAQQRLVTLAVALRRAEARVPPRSDELRADVTRVAEGLITAVNELRELSQGIHPAELTEGGLCPALRALGRRSPVRVELDVAFEDRLPDQVEVAAYYTVSEALTNASKHSGATRVWISLQVDDDVLQLSIRDDGVGGADASLGSGLTGLRDRIEALGGKLKIESPRGSGTKIKVEIPTSEAAQRRAERAELAPMPGPVR